jgi:hypothetical protein
MLAEFPYTRHEHKFQRGLAREEICIRVALKRACEVQARSQYSNLKEAKHLGIIK